MKGAPVWSGAQARTFAGKRDSSTPQFGWMMRDSILFVYVRLFGTSLILWSSDLLFVRDSDSMESSVFLCNLVVTLWLLGDLLRLGTEEVAVDGEA